MSNTKTDLVIVESPAKAKTIEKYLGSNYKVVASMGGDNAPGEIVRGAVLAHRELGVDITLVGQKERVDACLKNENCADVEVVDAREIISMQNIVVDTQYDGRAAIELLKRQDAGRGTFLPLDVIGGAVLDNVPSEDPGFVGVAYELAHFDEKYRGIFASLLGRTVVAETLSDAVRLSKKSNARLRIVTLDGQLINAGGSMISPKNFPLRNN